MNKFKKHDNLDDWKIEMMSHYIIFISIHYIFQNYLYDAYTISKSRSKTDNEFQAIDFCGAGII